MPSLDAILALLVTIGITTLVSPRLRLPLPIGLTLAGLALALLPGLPHPRLDPGLVLLVLLPPLLYADAFNTSWHDFVRWLRPILMLARGRSGAARIDKDIHFFPGCHLCATRDLNPGHG